MTKRQAVLIMRKKLRKIIESITGPIEKKCLKLSSVIYRVENSTDEEFQKNLKKGKYDEFLKEKMCVIFGCDRKAKFIHQSGGENYCCGLHAEKGDWKI